MPVPLDPNFRAQPHYNYTPPQTMAHPVLVDRQPEQDTPLRSAPPSFPMPHYFMLQALKTLPRVWKKMLIANILIRLPVIIAASLAYVAYILLTTFSIERLPVQYFFGIWGLLVLIAIVFIALILFYVTRIPFINYVILHERYRDQRVKSLIATSKVFTPRYYLSWIAVCVSIIKISVFVALVGIAIPYALLVALARFVDISVAELSLFTQIATGLGLAILCSTTLLTTMTWYFPLTPAIIDTGLSGKAMVVASRRFMRGYDLATFLNALIMLIVMTLITALTACVISSSTQWGITSLPTNGIIVGGAITLYLFRMIFIGPFLNAYQHHFFQYLKDVKEMNRIITQPKTLWVALSIMLLAFMIGFTTIIFLIGL